MQRSRSNNQVHATHQSSPGQYTSAPVTSKKIMQINKFSGLRTSTELGVVMEAQPIQQFDPEVSQDVSNSKEKLRMAPGTHYIDDSDDIINISEKQNNTFGDIESGMEQIECNKHFPQTYKAKKTPNKKIQNQENQSPFGVSNYFKTISDITNFNRRINITQDYQFDTDIALREKIINASSTKSNKSNKSLKANQKMSKSSERFVITKKSEYQIYQPNQGAPLSTQNNSSSAQSHQSFLNYLKDTQITNKQIHPLHSSNYNSCSNTNINNYQSTTSIRNAKTGKQKNKNKSQSTVSQISIAALSTCNESNRVSSAFGRESTMRSGNISVATNKTEKTEMIGKGLKHKSDIINQKNEQLSSKISEKKQLSLLIPQLKKEVVQTQKMLKGIKDNNFQIGQDIQKLQSLVTVKGSKHVQSSKEINIVRKEVKQLEKDVEESKNIQQSFQIELQAEGDLLEAVQQMVLNYKKQINDVRKEKEKLQIQVKTSAKQIDYLIKRKVTLKEDSAKLFMDFQDAMHQEAQ
ncbi:UNKNOWN [Stylonychia lemnae]|uniref:Uncharacterized protein n=1 Tax=Stylonychia lemnae TaxID=5949 RepID=A0A078ALG4_STYLE|nr:UNKNOWN [Stylonychia lemnae]|eukprot:CDW83059.1 UNKNOWN [Stylonychia lemnae]